MLDGAAKKRRQTVHESLGLRFAEGKHVSSLTIGLDSPAAIRRKVLDAEAFPILKLKLVPPDDSESLAALRELLRHIEALAADPHIGYVEQPMPAKSPVADLL